MYCFVLRIKILIKAVAPSIDLTMVLKQKSDKDLKKVSTKQGNPSYNFIKEF